MDSTVTTDDQLIQLALNGHADCAFEALVNRHSPRCLAVARMMLRDEDAAADAVQDAFIKAWRNLASFRNEAVFSSWLVSIVRNECLQQLRRRRRSPETYSIDVLQALEANRPSTLMPDPELWFLAAEREGLVRKSLHSLPRLFRDVVVEHHIREKGLSEVARELGVSSAAVKSRLHRGRAELKRKLVAAA